MNVWFAIPSARPNGGTATAWRERGYRVALWRDTEEGAAELCGDDGLIIVGQYQSYSHSVNSLVNHILKIDPNARWIVSGGDDTLPDPHQPEEIARECTQHFGGTFGVMQPTGDRWADGSIDRICGSPWMGREFCERINQGQGPMRPEYFHMFSDEEMQEVAIRLGILWQRRDLIHMHQHWMRETTGAPAFLQRANSRANWDAMKAIFDARKAAGFPGHEPLEVMSDCAAV